MKALIITITTSFARKKGVPQTIRGVILRETPRALYIYGRGEIDPSGRNTAIDGWFPKSTVRSQEPDRRQEPIKVPKNHPMTKAGETKTKSAELAGDGSIVISFPFDRDTLAQVKTLDGRRWAPNKPGKPWICPFTLENVERLEEWGFEIGNELERRIDRIRNPNEADDLVIPNQDRLYPFQTEGVRFIESRQGRALVADEMGLGKTIQALSWLAARPEKRPVLIICPASVKLNWARECRIWQVSHVEILSGKKPHPLTKDVSIINYDILPAWMKTLSDRKWEVIICDEIHYIKNSKAQRTKAVKKLGKRVPHFIGLSGTPILNRPVEIFNAVKIVEPTVLPRFFQFAKRYCGAYHNGFGWRYDGATNTKELHQKLTKTIMIRRLKKDVLKDLPPKVRSVVPMEIINRKEYAQAETDFIGWLRKIDVKKASKAEAAEALVKIETLKQLTIKGKIDQCCKWIEDYLEGGGKLVVFTTHQATVDKLMKVFKNDAVRFDGSTGAAARDKAIQRFQNDPDARLFVGNIKAAGVGITLTAASATCFIELGWTPGEHDQAEDRIHRIGQEADSVTAYYLVADGTIENSILNLLDKKRKVLAEVLDGKDVKQESMLHDLMITMKGE